MKPIFSPAGSSADHIGATALYGIIAAAFFALKAFGQNFAEPSRAADVTADTALVVAVDVSQSVDEERYRLQMEGIARALEDPGVIDTILSGANGNILLSVVVWADRARIAVPWQRIATKEQALQTAALVRALPIERGEFTCLARAMEFVKETVLAAMPGIALRSVVDVSGDGIDNCADRTANNAQRDILINAGITINGLPIIVKGENEIVGAGAYRAPGYDLGNLPLGPDTDTTTLDAWFNNHVIGGPGAFLLPANGYADFGRAFRQKFVTEISATAPLPNADGRSNAVIASGQ